MSDAARRKERRRLKREKKKAQERRTMAGSPYKRIGQVGRVEACYVNADWETNGIASIHLIRQNPQGGMALACFLIDLWCAGLKDAWGAIDMTSGDTDEHLKRAGEHVELVRIEPDAARHLIAGAIRFARQNGFRLPPHFERWTNLLGDLPDTATADLRRFGKDGGLLWIGSFDDLQRRLIGCSVDEFLARPNVHFMSEIEDFDDAEVDDDEDDDSPEGDEEFEEFLEAFGTLVEECYSNALRRCQERGETPLPAMREALSAMLLGELVSERFDMEPEDSPFRISAEKLMKVMQANLQIEMPPELKEVVEQIDRLGREPVNSEPAAIAQMPDAGGT
jgi:hypothetical protein